MGNKDLTQSDTMPEEIILNLESNKEAVGNLSTNGNNFSKLKKLNISSCELLNVPPVVCTFKYLTELDLSKNSLENLPNEIGNLQNLLMLNLSDNELISLPTTLRHVYHLTFLNISHNKFIEVPEVLYYGLRFIKMLDLSFNAICQFCDAPECLSNLVELRLSNNLLEKLPAWIFDNLCRLQILDVSENNIGFDSEPVVHYYSTGVFETLEVFNIENSNCKYENIQFLTYFKNLKSLYLGNKKLKGLKIGRNHLGEFKMDLFKNFNTIKFLYLQNVQISTLPRDIDCLENIEVLNLSDNELSWLPERFCNLISLKVLYLTSNQLLFLPCDIGKLVNLQQIHLGNNKLNEVPESFYSLKNLEFVDLYNNKIEKIDSKIFFQQKLSGVDLDLNYIDFSLPEFSADANELEKQYESLKKVFRKQFNYLDSRSDVQITKKKESQNEMCKDSPLRNRNSRNNIEDDLALEHEESLKIPPPVSGEHCEDEDDWEEKSCGVEKDEMFDPHGEQYVEGPKVRINNYWKSLFRNNFCPANGHMPSVMKTYVKNFKLTTNNDAEEGQFDSD